MGFIPAFSPVVPAFSLVIPAFSLVIPAKAGIHMLADSPNLRYATSPEPPAHCAVAPPSITSGWPVMNDDSPQARNSAP